jgi:hypothetical protein
MMSLILFFSFNFLGSCRYLMQIEDKRKAKAKLQATCNSYAERNTVKDGAVIGHGNMAGNIAC